jgi:Cu+-exporting ATPase
MTGKILRLKLEGVRCDGCRRSIETALEQVPGVRSTSINMALREADIDGNPRIEDVVAAIEHAGYGASPVKDDQSSQDDEANRAYYRRLIRDTLIALGVGLPLMVFGMFESSVDLSWTPLRGFWVVVAIATGGVLAFSGRHFFIGAWRAFRAHSATMDTLIALGTGTAWLFSTVIVLMPSVVPEVARHVYFEAAAIIIGLVNLGQALELRARGKTSQAIRRLLDLQDKTARVLRDGEEIDIPIDSVVAGDVIRVRPGESVAVDGKVLDGHTNIDESMLTGEPMPVPKSKGDEVAAGTLNKTGSILFRATRVGADTALARIIKMVRQAQNSKPPIGRLADTISGVFVPSVMLIAVTAALVWFNFGPQPKVAYSLVTAVTVLIIACPCALGLATPMSVMVGIGKAAEAGVLIRNGEALQTASQLTTLVLDKTGTITAGHPEVVAIIPTGQWQETDVLRLAAGLEAGSEHPLAQAVVTAANERNLDIPQATDFQAVAGLGVEGRFDGQSLAFGNLRFMDQREVLVASSLINESQSMAEDAKTPMFFAIDGELAALFAVADPIKPDSAAAIERMHAAGLTVVMLTGDNRHTAEAVARQVGIDEVRAEVLPDDKHKQVADLQQRGEKVGMVGDGINDAPALALADVGFAIGTGTDIAIESADVTLIRGSLHGVADAVAVSRATLRNIKQNLTGAFIYNAAGIPVAAGVLYPLIGVLLNPIIAGAAMAFSSLTVVSNANRLRLFNLYGPGS